ncbi:hypothetical protein Peur_069239 [Populus x canadensis]
MPSPTTRLPFLSTEVKLTVLAICPSGERGSLLWTKISRHSSPYHYNPISTINHLKNFP